MERAGHIALIKGGPFVAELLEEQARIGGKAIGHLLPPGEVGRR